MWLASAVMFTPHIYKYDSLDRMPASESCTEIISKLIIAPPSYKRIENNTLDAYQTKNNLWNKILSTKDFENFDETNYFRYIEIYTNEKNLSLITPTTIEEKMALIEVIQNRYAYFIGVQSLQEELNNLSTKKLHKIVSLIEDFDPTSKVTREDLQDFTSELFIILKGPPTSLLDYFTENKTEKMGKRLYRIVQEELLIKGMKNVIMQFPEKTHYTMIEKAKIHINRITRSKLWRLTSLPLDLPFIDQVKLSDELLEKILLDGIDAHSDELITHFKKINMIDNYERFRKAYRGIAFAVTFSYFYQDIQAKIKIEVDKKDEEVKQGFLESFKKLAELIARETSANEKTDKEIKDEQFKRVVKAFQEKYHENPTPEEYKEIKQKIYGN